VRDVTFARPAAFPGVCIAPAVGEELEAEGERGVQRDASAARALATAARVADMISPSAQLFAIFAVLVWILAFINFGTRQVDYRILGVHGVAFSDDSVTLRFRGEPPAPILEMPRV